MSDNLIDIHLHGDDDHSPIQMISARRLAYYQGLERDLAKTLQQLQQALEALDRLAST